MHKYIRKKEKCLVLQSPIDRMWVAEVTFYINKCQTRSSKREIPKRILFFEAL